MAARTVIKALLTGAAGAMVLIAQNAQSDEIGAPRTTAMLEKTNAAIETGLASTVPKEIETKPPVPSSGPAQLKGNPLWAIPLRALAVTRDRPLFSVSRRPASPVVTRAMDPAPKVASVAIKPSEPERPPFILVGTIVGAGTRIAVLLNQTTKLVTRVREGEDDSGWTVKAILPHSTVLEKDARSATLELPKQANVGNSTGTVSENPAPPIIRNVHEATGRRASPARPPLCHCTAGNTGSM